MMRQDPTLLPSMFANHQIRHQATHKWTVSLAIANGHLIFLRSLCGYVLVNIFFALYNVIVHSVIESQSVTILTLVHSSPP